MAVGALAGVLPLDFASAFPSLSHAWLLRVLHHMRSPIALLRDIGALYAGFATTVSFCEQPIATFPVTNGIKQGCPLSGTMFAIAPDPLARRCLTQVALDSARLKIFADDIASASSTISSTYSANGRRRRGYVCEAASALFIVIVGDHLPNIAELRRREASATFRVVEHNLSGHRRWTGRMPQPVGHGRGQGREAG